MSDDRKLTKTEEGCKVTEKQNRQKVLGYRAPEGAKQRKEEKKKERFMKLKELPYFDELKKKIVAGIAVEEVARWIQEDMLGYLDVRRDSLSRQLYRFKASLPPAELVREPPMYIRKRIEKLKHGVNEVEELEKLYLLQLTRLNIDVQTEEKINKLFAGTGREIQLAAELLTKMIEKKMALGILAKTPQRFEFSGDLGALTLSLDGQEGGDVDEDRMTRLGLVASRLISTVSKLKDGEDEQKRVDEEEEEELDDE